MTRIDFYILEGRQDAGRHLQIACRLAEKAWSGGQRVYIHTDEAVSAKKLDDMLWSFRAESFLPHQLLAEGQDSDALTPIHIGWNEPPAQHDQVLINLAAEIPLCFSRFDRVAEIVSATEQAREQGRQRYRFYRDRGYPLQTHRLAQG